MENGSMRVALECQSLLLQDALRFYLSSYLCDMQDCDFIISDYLNKGVKPVYYLSFQHQTLPFSPEGLMEDLKVFYQKNCNAPYPRNSKSSHSNDEKLRSEIQSLLMEFADRFLQTIKKYK